MGALECQVFSRSCLAGSCKILPHKEAEKKGIFFLTKKSAAGDEIGWDFIRRVQGMRVSFSGFCKDMSSVYSTNNTSTVHHFMSGTTFVSWVFGWLSAFKIDFRKEIDPWCGHSPKILACDGTHIGVSVKLAHLENPVTKEELPEQVIKPRHKRYICDRRTFNMIYVTITFINLYHNFDRQNVFQVQQDTHPGQGGEKPSALLVQESFGINLG